MWFSYTVKPQFTVENEKAISVAPKVDFSKQPAPTSAPTAVPAPATK
jgi:LemA protein